MINRVVVVLCIVASLQANANRTESFEIKEMIQPMQQQVDLQKYVGKWFEVASIPQLFQKQCVSDVTAEYSFAEMGLIKVINSCKKMAGDFSIAEGRARVEDAVLKAKLKVTFVKMGQWNFDFAGNYWILDLNEDYTLALVGDPTLQYAWILSREANVPLDVLIQAEKKFKLLGYDTCQILTTVQSGGSQSRESLCQLKASYNK